MDEKCEACCDTLHCCLCILCAHQYQLLLLAAGFDHASSNIDLNVVRLCFQVFLPDANGKVTRVVPPVSSLPIHDKSKGLN